MQCGILDRILGQKKGHGHRFSSKEQVSFNFMAAGKCSEMKWNENVGKCSEIRWNVVFC